MITYIVGLLVGVAWLSVEVAPVSCNPNHNSTLLMHLRRAEDAGPIVSILGELELYLTYVYHLTRAADLFLESHINQIDDDDDVHKVRYFTSSIIQIAHMGPSLLAQAKASSKK